MAKHEKPEPPPAKSANRRAELEGQLEMGRPEPWVMGCCPRCGAHVPADFRFRHTSWHLELEGGEP